MRLFEITNQSFHKINSSGKEFRNNLGVRDLNKAYAGRDGSPDPKPKNKLVKVLGHGQYATAIQKVGSKEVMKISRGTNDVNDDPYYQYISRLASGDYVQNNPYFPRVYNMKVYETTDQSYKYFYIAIMEELHHLTDLTKEELIKIIGNVIRPKLTSRVKQTFSKFDPTKNLRDKTQAQLIEILVTSVRSYKIKDPLLNAAVDFVLSFAKEPDITERNIMFRKTPNGPQLVMADPLRD